MTVWVSLWWWLGVLDLITDWMVNCGGLGLYLDLLLLLFDYILVLGLGVCLFVVWVGWLGLFLIV